MVPSITFLAVSVQGEFLGLCSAGEGICWNLTMALFGAAFLPGFPRGESGAGDLWGCVWLLGIIPNSTKVSKVDGEEILWMDGCKSLLL